jgi:hypothetical protein
MRTWLQLATLSDDGCTSILKPITFSADFLQSKGKGTLVEHPKEACGALKPPKIPYKLHYKPSTNYTQNYIQKIVHHRPNHNLITAHNHPQPPPSLKVVDLYINQINQINKKF